jgi:hypothetical protein
MFPGGRQGAGGAAPVKVAVDPSQLFEGGAEIVLRGVPAEVTGVVGGYIPTDYGTLDCVLVVPDAFGGGLKIRCDEVFAPKGSAVTVRCDLYVRAAFNGFPAKPGCPSGRYLSHREASPDASILSELAAVDAAVSKERERRPSPVVSNGSES